LTSLLLSPWYLRTSFSPLFETTSRIKGHFLSNLIMKGEPRLHPPIETFSFSFPLLQTRRAHPRLIFCPFRREKSFPPPLAFSTSLHWYHGDLFSFFPGENASPPASFFPLRASFLFRLEKDRSRRCLFSGRCCRRMSFSPFPLPLPFVFRKSQKSAFFSFFFLRERFPWHLMPLPPAVLVALSG